MCATTLVFYNQTTAALSISLGEGVNPSFVIERTEPTTSTLVSGLFPVLNLDIVLLLTVRAILGNGQVVLVADVELNEGDVIGVYYVASGLTINLDLGTEAESGTVWSVHRIT